MPLDVAAAARFFTELEADNTRAFWEANRDRYAREVREPFLGLLDGLSPVVGAWRVYRPHNDTRFGGRAAYKTFIGAVGEGAGGVGYFVQVAPRGLLVASGQPMMAPDQLARFRAAVDDDATGAEFAALAEAFAADDRPVTPGRYPPLTGAPRGIRRDHPRIAYLRWKGVELARRLGAPGWAGEADAADRIRALWDDGTPMHAWLARHVGPSEIPPEELWGRGRRRSRPPRTASSGRR